jgi:predicted PurR-regulated permease PerM
LNGLVYLLAPILTPFAISALLAYLADPLTDRLENWKLNRTGAVVVVFAVMLLVLTVILLIIIPLLENQISYLLDRLPVYLDWVRDVALPQVQAWLGLESSSINLDAITQLLREHWQKAGGFAAVVVGYLTSSGAALVTMAANLVLIPVVTFYLLRDWDTLVVSIRRLVPLHLEATLVKLTRESDSMLSAFIRGQLLVMLGLGVIYSLGLWLAGIDLAFLIGMGAGILSFVPYLGSILGVVGAVIAALVQYHDLVHILLVLLVFGVGQAVEGMLLTPWLVGDKIGLHPVAVIFAIMAGGQLFGFLGVLLALPVAAVLNVLIKHVHELYKGSRIYERDPVKIEEL